LHGTFCLLTGRTEMARTSFESFRKLFNELPEQDKKIDSNQKVFIILCFFRDILLQLSVNMHIKHASLCMQMADRERADAELAAGVALDALNPDAYHHRAQLRMINGDMQLALEDYDVCCRLAPDFDVAQSV
jgi:tetratricopeptide (TPR) repeat protein